MRTKILALTVLLLAGCATSSTNLATNLNKISVGMPRSTVIKILGPPEHIHANQDIEYLVYLLKERFTTKKDGLVSEDVKYFVKLVGGRVESFGRLGIR